MLHTNFAADFDFTDEELAVLKSARKVKMGHVYGDKAVANHASRAKGACRKDALQAIQIIQFHHNRYGEELREGQKMPRRAYRCHECRNGYHLTSKAWAPYGKDAKIIAFKRPVVTELLQELADVA